jgi:hypothetical protein
VSQLLVPCSRSQCGGARTRLGIVQFEAQERAGFKFGPGRIDVCLACGASSAPC